jgi:uncharacterized protein
MSEGDPNQVPPSSPQEPGSSAPPPIPQNTGPENATPPGSTAAPGPAQSASSWSTPPGMPFPAPGSPGERSWAVAIHVSPLIAHILGPLVLWLIKRPDSPYLDAVGKEVLNFQISFVIYEVVALAVSPFTCGLGHLVFAVLFLIWVVLVIIAAVKVSGGEDYRYPLTIRLIR